MFAGNSAADRLATALAEYQRDFERRLQAKPNPDAKEAEDRINRAKNLVDQSGLGNALLVLLEHTKHWPTWSTRDDFRQWVGFPVEQVLAREELKQERHRSTKVVVVLFIYRGNRYGVVFTDNGGSAMPDGEYYRHGTVEFVVSGEVVLGLDISLSSDEFPEWRSFGVNALKMGAWSKALLEIGAYIRVHTAQSIAKRREEHVIGKAKNITL